MFIYLLGGEAEDNEIRQLRKDVFESRRNTPEGEQPPKAVDYDGGPVTEDDFELPPRW